MNIVARLTRPCRHQLASLSRRNPKAYALARGGMLVTAMVLATACQKEALPPAQCPEPGPDAPSVWVVLGADEHTAEGRKPLVQGLSARLQQLAAGQGANVTVFKVANLGEESAPVRQALPAVPLLPSDQEFAKTLSNTNAFKQSGVKREREMDKAQVAACQRVLAQRMQGLTKALEEVPQGTAFSNVWDRLKTISDELATMRRPETAHVIVMGEDEGSAFHRADAPNATPTCCKLRGANALWLGIWAPTVREEEERRVRWQEWVVERMGASSLTFVRPGGAVPNLS